MKKEIKRYWQQQLATICCLFSLLIVTNISCTDSNVSDITQQKEQGVTVQFNVKEVTRAYNDRVTRTNNANDNMMPCTYIAATNTKHNIYITETTENGINLTQPTPITRAMVKRKIDANFLSFGFRGASKNGITTTPDWFWKADTKENGQLVKPLRWEWEQPFARFYAIYPKNLASVSEKDNEGAPYINFEVDEDVSKQVDLMTACTGVVHYATQGIAPRTDLNFRHALTAVRFAIGDNKDLHKTISKIEIENVITAAKYTLSQEPNQPGEWEIDDDASRGTVTLDNLTFNAEQNPNAIIMDETANNYTFYMIPQMLDGKDVKVNIYCDDDTKISFKLKGEWKQGTTRTYKIGSTSKEYFLTVSSPAVASFKDKNTTPYNITSYRIDPNTKKIIPVNWKIIGYDNNGDNKFSIDEKPSWITSHSENGKGGEEAHVDIAQLRTENPIDLLKLRNEKLSNATIKGSQSSYYNLANQTNGGDKIENTANSYLISAPGYYRIPLVYGNAIKNGIDDTAAYKPNITEKTNVLTEFVDHNGKPISSPYINIQNKSQQAISASLLWADVKHLVQDLKVEGTGDKSFVTFKINKEDIQTGNAVVAIKNNKGIIMWSWHIWVAPTDVLNTIACKDDKGKTYKFANEPLGMKYTEWYETPTKTPRIVRLKVKQQEGGNQAQTAIITIAQKPYSEKEYTATYYQFGRKDAFPDTYNPAEGVIKDQTVIRGNNKSFTDVSRMDYKSGILIQNPTTIYAVDAKNVYFNLWSANETSKIYKKVVPKDVVKTIYDPSPVGFKVPNINAFNAFTKDNVIEKSQKGWLFQLENNANIFIPTLGYLCGEADFQNPYFMHEKYVVSNYATANISNTKNPVSRDIHIFCINNEDKTCTKNTSRSVTCNPIITIAE